MMLGSVELQKGAVQELSFGAGHKLAALDRLAQPLHGELDILRLQMAPALDLGLVPLFRKALEILRSVLAGGIALLREFLADKRVSWHRSFLVCSTSQTARFRY